MDSPQERVVVVKIWPFSSRPAQASTLRAVDQCEHPELRDMKVGDGGMHCPTCGAFVAGTRVGDSRKVSA